MIGSSHVLKLLKCDESLEEDACWWLPNFRHIQWQWEILNIGKDCNSYGCDILYIYILHTAVYQIFGSETQVMNKDVNLLVVEIWLLGVTTHPKLERCMTI